MTQLLKYSKLSGTPMANQQLAEVHNTQSSLTKISNGLSVLSIALFVMMEMFYIFTDQNGSH